MAYYKFENYNEVLRFIQNSHITFYKKELQELIPYHQLINLLKFQKGIVMGTFVLFKAGEVTTSDCIGIFNYYLFI